MLVHFYQKIYQSVARQELESVFDKFQKGMQTILDFNLIHTSRNKFILERSAKC